MNKTQTFKAGDIIVEKGTPATQAYLVLKGHAQAYMKKNGRVVTLADLEIGSIFGESALFEKNDEYGAYVKAAEDTEVAILNPEDFKEKVEACDPLIQRIIHTLIERQRGTNEALLERETQEYMELEMVDITEDHSD